MGKSLFAQNNDNERLADSLALKAVEYVDDFQLDKAIEYFEKANALYDKKARYQYEKGLATYIKGDIAKAATIFKSVVTKFGDKDEQFLMLGNAYDELGKREKAINILLEGLKKFPKSGVLYQELGAIELDEKNYDKALQYWEKGIQLDPYEPSNYYWATKMFAYSSEKIWAIIYGELFLNLEFETPRAAEVSKILYNTYGKIYESSTKDNGKFDLTQSEFNLFSDSKLVGNYSSTNEIKILPFESEYALKFEPNNIIYAKEKISIEMIHDVRFKFLTTWMDSKDNSQLKFGHVLFPFHQQLINEDYFKCYNYYLMMYGSFDEFENYYQANKDLFHKFSDWYNKNMLDFEAGKYCRFDM